MKTILLFAPLALAASASACDIQKMFTIFNQNLGFNDAQVQDGNACLMNGVVTSVHQITQIVGVLQHQGLEEAISQGTQLFPGAENNLESQCQAYVNDLINYLIAQGNGKSAEQNFEAYGPEVIQKIAQSINAAQADAQTGDFTNSIGLFTEAIKILLGTEEPEVLPAPIIDWTKTGANVDAAEAVQTSIQTYFDTLGLGDKVNVTEIISGAQGFYNLNINNITSTIETQYRDGDFDGLITTLEDVSTTILEDVRGAKSLIDAELLVAKPIFSAFAHKPVKALLETLNNYALNLPEIINNEQQAFKDQVEGNYEEAAKLKAEQVLTVFKDVVDFTN